MPLNYTRRERLLRQSRALGMYMRTIKILQGEVITLDRNVRRGGPLWVKLNRRKPEVGTN